MPLVTGIYNQHLLAKRPCSRVPGGSQLHQDRPQEPATTAARTDENAGGDDGGRAPGTSPSWCWDGWTRRSPATPGTAGSPVVAGEVEATRIKHPPSAGRASRREEQKDIDDRVPPALAQLLVRFHASILVDRTWGEVAGWCAAVAANLLGLNLGHELVTGNPNVEQASHLGVTTVADNLGCDAPSAERLRFQGPPGRPRRPR
jgi:hypothetical protein